MSRSPFRYLSPARWARFFRGQIELYRRRRADAALDQEWAQYGRVPLVPASATVIADGLWFNQGYFLRLRLFLAALAGQHQFSLVGILRDSKSTRARRTLEAIGFSDFIYVDADKDFPVAAFEAEASRLLAGLRSHEDILAAELPFKMPAYVWYDTVLKKVRHPRPPLDHPEWRKSLAELLAYLAIYDRLLKTKNVSHVALSHAWKNEWAALTWLAMQRGIPVYNLTASSESIRIRRLERVSDYDVPIDSLSYQAFSSLPATVRGALSDIGKSEIDKRSSVEMTDINVRHAYLPDRRSTDRKEARALLQVDDRKPLGVIYGHAWFDFPHVFAMANFADFLDWFDATIRRVSELTDVTWLLKPHPLEHWYGGYQMIEGLKNLPPHVRLLPPKFDTLTVMSAADAVITVHGTIGIEAAANGIPVVLADHSFYSDWGFAHLAGSRSEYFDLLGRVGSLSAPTAEQRRDALACFASTYVTPGNGVSALRIPCDSLGSKLSYGIRDLVRQHPDLLANEVNQLADFIKQNEFNSYTTFGLVSAQRQRFSGTAAA